MGSRDCVGTEHGQARCYCNQTWAVEVEFLLDIGWRDGVQTRHGLYTLGTVEIWAVGTVHRLEMCRRRYRVFVWTWAVKMYY